MSTKDARSIMFNNAMNQLKEVHVEELASAERKCEFRYNNQDKRLKELEATIKELRGKNRDLRKKLKELEG